MIKTYVAVLSKNTKSCIQEVWGWGRNIPLRANMTHTNPPTHTKTHQCKHINTYFHWHFLCSGLSADLPKQRIMEIQKEIMEIWNYIQNMFVSVSLWLWHPRSRSLFLPLFTLALYFQCRFTHKHGQENMHGHQSNPFMTDGGKNNGNTRKQQHKT